MTAPDTDTFIALAREGRIAVVPVEATAWQWRSRIKGGSWDAWEQGRFNQEVPPFAEVEERASFTVPANAPTLTPALLALAEERDAAFAFIADLVNMQSGQGWSRSVVREAAANFLCGRGAKIPHGPDKTPDMIARARALTGDTP